jgi:hypothetical protein
MNFGDRIPFTGSRFEATPRFQLGKIVEELIVSESPGRISSSFPYYELLTDSGTFRLLVDRRDLAETTTTLPKRKCLNSCSEMRGCSSKAAVPNSSPLSQDSGHYLASLYTFVFFVRTNPILNRNRSRRTLNAATLLSLTIRPGKPFGSGHHSPQDSQSVGLSLTARRAALWWRLKMMGWRID